MSSLEQNLVLFSFCCYFVASVICLAEFWFRSRSLEKAGAFFTVTGFLLLNAALVARAVVAGRMPGSNLYEFLLLFAWGMTAIYLFIMFKYRFQVVGAFLLPLVVAMIGCAALFTSQLRPLMPALQSPWLQFHVTVAIFAYSAFAVSCALAVLSLLNFPITNSQCFYFDDLIYGCNAFGFSLLTFVILTGAVWAEGVWGSWWGWDPKETASLVTWLIFVFYLHLRHSRYWNSNRGAWLTCLGFLAVIFTLLGITFLVSGLHSYT